MTYLVLARRWRPQTFADIVGQEHVTRTLQNAIRAGRVAHAFLFTGVRGVGKTTAARVLAKALNCENGPAPEPCNTCVHCEEIANGASLDVVEIDGASNTGVDDVRAIIENVRYRPAKCRFKIYIVDEVHMLSTSAFNALLKTLEEPPAHVKFIFATTDPHKVPATIQSRCQRYDFKRLPLSLIVRQLGEIAAKEGLEISEKGLFLIARESEGSMRDAQSLLDQTIAFAGRQITEEQILGALGLADRTLVAELASALIARTPSKVLEIVEQVHLRGDDLRRFVRDSIEHFRNIAVVQAGASDLLKEELPVEELQNLQKQAETVSFLDVERIFRTLLQVEAELGRSPVPRLYLEMHLLRLAMTEPLLSLATLGEELRQLASGSQVPVMSPRGQGKPLPEDGEKLPGSLMTGKAGAERHSPAPGKATSGAISGAIDGAVRGQREGGESSSREGDSRWREFLQFVEKRRRFIAAHLQASVGVEWGEASLKVRIPNGIHYQYLTHGARVQELATLAAEFFGSPLSVQIEAVEPEKSAQDGQEQERSTDLRRQVLDYAAVRKTVDILGAEIREVREQQGVREKGSF